MQVNSILHVSNSQGINEMQLLNGGLWIVLALSGSCKSTVHTANLHVSPDTKSLSPSTWEHSWGVRVTCIDVQKVSFHFCSVWCVKKPQCDVEMWEGRHGWCPQIMALCSVEPTCVPWYCPSVGQWKRLILSPSWSVSSTPLEAWRAIDGRRLAWIQTGPMATDAQIVISCLGGWAVPLFLTEVMPVHRLQIRKALWDLLEDHGSPLTLQAKVEVECKYELKLGPAQREMYLFGLGATILGLLSIQIRTPSFTEMASGLPWKLYFIKADSCIAMCLAPSKSKII